MDTKKKSQAPVSGANRIVSTRYDALLLLDACDSGGNQDETGSPHTDSETGNGWGSGPHYRRRIRDYVACARGDADDSSFHGPLVAGQKRFEIYVADKAVLNLQHKRAFAGIGREDVVRQGEDKQDSDDKAGRRPSRIGTGSSEEAKEWMCRNFWDVRTFGAVMSSKVNAGQVRGAVQLSDSRSVDPVVPVTYAITRVAVTDEKKAAELEGDNRTIGRKSKFFYALFTIPVFILPFYAEKSGFDEEDLALFWEALLNAWELDRSSSRGLVTAQKLFVFKHANKLGNATADSLFKRVKIVRKNLGIPARTFEDYDVSVNTDGMPAGVELIEMR